MKRISKTRVAVIFFMVTVSLALFVSILWANFYILSGYGAGPMVQQVEADGFTLVWWNMTAESGKVSVITSNGNEVSFEAVRTGDRFEARVRGLSPGTVYPYKIFMSGHQQDEALWREGETRTAKTGNTPFSFAVFGDSGSGSQGQYRLAETIESYPLDLILHAGDLVYSDGETEHYQKKFFSPYENIIAKVPFYPVLGNHDVRTENGAPFLETFSLPDNGPAGLDVGRCYWFSFAGAQFVGIDSTLDREILEQQVAPWLAEVLGTSEAEWKFVFLHHPPFSSATPRSGCQAIAQVLVPVFEETGVDVVFCGHNHFYERIGPLLNGEVDPDNGVLYVISGAGGKSLRKLNHLNPFTKAFYSASYSFTYVEVEEDVLKLRQINQRNEVVDEYILEKSDHTSGLTKKQ